MRRELTFQKGRTPSGSQWVKTIRGKRHYFGPARSPTNKEDYLAAIDRYRQFLATTPSDTSPRTAPPSRPRKYGARHTGRIANMFYDWNLTRIHADHFGPRDKGSISRERASSLKHDVSIFVNWFGPTRHLASLEGMDLIVFNSYLVDLGYAHNTKSAIKASVKQFLMWAYTTELISRLPRNFFQKNTGPLSISWRPPHVRIFNWKSPSRGVLPEIRRLYEVCRGHSLDAELFFLLATNCGYTQVDIATLDWTHIRRRAGNDWFIERPRHKTHVMSRHLLWDRTRELLLQRHSACDGVGIVLRTSTNRSHYRLNSNGSVTSGIPQTLKRLIRKTFGDSDDRSLKHLRKTGASFIAERSPGTDSIYLAHTPSTMAARHYSVATFNHLSRALVAMESQFLGIPFNNTRFQRYSPD